MVSAETLVIALVVLVGATVIGMVKSFFAEPWDTQEGTVYVERRVYQPVPVPLPQPGQPRALPAPQPEKLPDRVPVPVKRRKPVPEPALVLAAD